MKLKKLRILLGVLVVLALIPTAQASTWDEVKAVGGSLWDKAKEKGSEVIGTVKEKGPGWVETGKEKAGELLDQAGDAISSAQQKFSSWSQSQQDEFWQRTENMLESGQNPSADTSPSPAPTDSPAPTPTPAPEASDLAPTPSPTPSNSPVESSANPDAPLAIMFYNGHWYREVAQGGELSLDGKMFIRDDSLGVNAPAGTTDQPDMPQTDNSNPEVILVTGTLLLGACFVSGLAFFGQSRKKH